MERNNELQVGNTTWNQDQLDLVWVLCCSGMFMDGTGRGAATTTVTDFLRSPFSFFFVLSLLYKEI